MLSTQQLQKSLEPALNELGLTEYEKKLYLTSLSIGPAPVSGFAKHLGISRPNVYKVILGLEKHGLARFSDRETRTRTFVVESPHVLLRRLKEKRENLERVDRDTLGILPDLLALYQQGDRATALKVFDTKKAWVELYFRVLEETKGDYLFFGNVERFVAFEPSLQPSWVAARVRRNLRGRLLALPGDVAREKSLRDREELRETRFLTNTKPFESSFLVFGKKVIIWQPNAPIAILIEDEYVTNMFRSVFEAFWGQARTFADGVT